jgi:S-adenosylmethionine hydrolase
MGTRYDTISLLTDYGHADEFVGVLHAVARDIAPHAVVLDIAHEIAPHDVRAGGLTLLRAAQYLPAGVVVAVVDPGVGTERRAIAVEVGDGMSVLVGPDNGLLAPAVSMCGGAGRVVELTSEAHRLPAPGATFAGRDIFVPAAAHLCNGVDLLQLGPLVDPDSLLPAVLPITRSEDDGLHAEVLWVDRFGNAQLNVDPAELDGLPGCEEVVALRFNDTVRVATRADTYAGLGTGRPGLVTDSYGLLSVCLERASAADELGLAPGTGIVLSAPE